MGSLNRGIQGLRQLGVRELTYKLVFLASSVRNSESNMGTINIRELDESEADIIKYVIIIIIKYVIIIIIESVVMR
jgi:hypothetical protein